MNHSSDLLHELAEAIIGAMTRTKTERKLFSSTNKWNFLGKLVSPRNATCVFLLCSGFLQEKSSNPTNPICYCFSGLSPDDDDDYYYILFLCM